MMTPKLAEESLLRQIDDVQKRLDLLVASATGDQQQPGHEALQELSTTLEELRVASEELRAQNEELTATRQQVEIQRGNYQSLFTLAPDAYFVTDTAGVIQQANRKAGELLGVRDDFLLGKPISLFFPAEHRPQYRALLLKLARSDALPDSEIDMTIQPRNAATIPVAVTISVIRQSQASGWRSVGLRWIVRDMSVRKRNEDQIKNQVRRLTVLGAINSAITSTLELDTIVDVLFEKLEDYFTYPVAITLRLFHPESGELEPLFCRNIEEAGWKAGGTHTPGARGAQAISSGRPVVVADLATDPRSNRSDFYKSRALVSAVTVPIIAKDEVLGVVTVYSKQKHDFTPDEVDLLDLVGQQAAIALQNSRLYEEVKKQSAELQAAHTRLEEKVEERTAELARTNDALRGEIAERRKIEERLRDSEAKLRLLTQEQEQQLIASDRLVSVGELAASIAHEFNNPLQIIMGFAQELLEEEQQTGPRRDGLKIIEAETVRCRELIRNLMNFARPQSAKPEATDLEPIVANAARLAWHYLIKAKVRLQTDIAQGLPAVKGDANQLQQVLINLLFNAAEAMPNGGEVKITAAVSADKTIVVSVADTGIGIPESALPHIFRPFFTTKQKKGMGLGLSICERIVRGHGGHIAIESAPGRGTTFHLHFPIAEENYERAS
jgi:PAS domain S-box-containing protein